MWGVGGGEGGGWLSGPGLRVIQHFRCSSSAPTALSLFYLVSYAPHRSGHSFYDLVARLCATKSTTQLWRIEASLLFLNRHSGRLALKFFFFRLCICVGVGVKWVNHF